MQVDGIRIPLDLNFLKGQQLTAAGQVQTGPGTNSSSGGAAPATLSARQQTDGVVISDKNTWTSKNQTPGQRSQAQGSSTTGANVASNVTVRLANASELGAQMSDE